jgi:hypothetical protein
VRTIAADLARARPERDIVLAAFPRDDGHDGVDPVVIAGSAHLRLGLNSELAEMPRGNGISIELTPRLRDNANRPGAT